MRCRRSDFPTEDFENGPDSSTIQNGLVACTCSAKYPVIDGVLRMLLPYLTPLLPKTYPAYFEAYESRVAGLDRESGRERIAKGIADAVTHTAESFGYEWNAFSQLLPEYEANFRHHFEGHGDEYFRDRFVLDAGCGTGRHAYYAAKLGAEVVALDPSRAIDAAARNCQDAEQMHFVQTDINHLPFKRNSFDLAYSIGVQHHLPDPEAGFRELTAFVKPSGDVHIYVYHQKEDSPLLVRLMLQAVTQVRKITTALPYTLLKEGLLIALVSYGLFILPARILKRLGLRNLAKPLPLQAYSDSPFRAVFKDTFDRLSAPIENRYRREENEAWFGNAGLSAVEIRDGTGWRVSGKKVALDPVSAAGG